MDYEKKINFINQVIATARNVIDVVEDVKELVEEFINGSFSDDNSVYGNISDLLEEGVYDYALLKILARARSDDPLVANIEKYFREGIVDAELLSVIASIEGSDERFGDVRDLYSRVKDPLLLKHLALAKGSDPTFKDITDQISDSDSEEDIRAIVENGLIAR